MEQAAQALFEQNIGPMQEGAFSIEYNIIKEIINKGNYGRNRFSPLVCKDFPGGKAVCFCGTTALLALSF